MAQYKHSRLAKIRLTGSDPNNRTFSGTMLAFIFALLLTLVIAGIISIGITFTTDSTPSLDPYKGTIALSNTLALDGPYSNHISEGWTFVPNVTPDMVDTAFAGFADEDNKVDWPSSTLLNNSPYVENIKIRDSADGSTINIPVNGKMQITASVIRGLRLTISLATVRHISDISK